MTHVQGGSGGAGGEDRLPPRDPKGKDKVAMITKKTMKKSRTDKSLSAEWQRTLRTACAHADIESGRAQPATQFTIRDQTGSLVAPERPPPPRPPHSGRTRTQSMPASAPAAATIPSTGSDSPSSAPRRTHRPREHRLQVVGVDIIHSDPSATAEAETEAEADSSEDSSSSEELEVSVEDIRQTTPSKLW